MKKTFAIEIEEDNAKLDQFRQIAPPVVATGEVSRRAAVGAGGAPRFGAPPPVPAAAKAGSQQMGWDDEELDTQIFDKEPTELQMAPPGQEKSDAELFFEDEDRTVATEPSPDILEQARPPESLITPKPEPTLSITLASEDLPDPTPPPAAAKPKLAPRRPTLTGIPAPAVSRTATRPVPPPALSLPTPPPTPPPAAPPPSLRRSSPKLPPLHAVAPTPPPAPAPPPVYAPQPAMPPPPRLSPRQTFPSQPTPFGSGNFADQVTMPTPRKKGGGLGMVLVVLLIAAGGAGYWYYSTTTRPGRIEVTATPADATVLVDNTKVGDHAPVSFEKPAGPYTLSVVKDGYVRSDQNIEVRAGQRLPLTVALEPSPDTGFELTSEPPGGLVWLDGSAIKGASGQQARTDFRAFRITPGHHLLEIKGEDRFKPWRQEIDVQPGAIQKVHAMLSPSSGAGSSAAARPAPPPPPPPPPAAAPSPPAETAAVTPPADSGAHHAASGAVHHKRAHEAPAGGGELAAGGDDDTPKPAADSGGDCSITVNSIPWSEVWIDGKNTTQHTPLVDYKVPCGKHKLSFKRTDMSIDHTENIAVRGKFKQRYTLATDE